MVGLKLSDNYSKALGPPSEIERYRRVFGTAGIANVPLVAYLEALKSQGNDADLYYNLALAQANGKQFDAGLQSIDKAITLRPNETAFTELKKRIADFKDNETLGNAQSVLNDGDKLFKAADYPNALAKYQEALKMIPDEKKSQQAVVLDQIAKTEAELKQGDSAIATWQKAIDAVEADSAYKDALGKLAECRKANQGSASDKCAAPQQEVTKYATRADMYRNDQAQFFIKEKKYDQAIDLYEKTFSDPNAAGNQPMDQSLFNLGQKLSNQDASEVAQLAFERAIKVNPQNAEAYYELGMLLYQGKKADKQAVDMLSKYLELGKDTAHKENAQNVLVVLKRRMK